MKGLTLKHLRYFLALSQQGHFGRAADVCAVSQPALSMQIKELEAIVRAPLVERGARQIRLTSLGGSFAERAEAILQAVDDLSDLARVAHGPMSGLMRLGVIPTIAPYLLPQIIQMLGARFPGVQLHPSEAVTRRLIADLLAGNLDMAVLALPIAEPGLQEFALFDEDFVLVRPAAQANAPVPGPARLRQMRLLLLEEGHCFRDQALSFCGVNNQPRDVMEGSSLSTLVQMVGAGIGVTLIPEMAVPLETRSANVAISHFSDPGPKRTVGMVWRKTNPFAEQFMEIGAVIRTVAQS